MHSRSMIFTVLLCIIALMLLTVRLDRPAPVEAQRLNALNPHIGTCPIFSADNVWNRPITQKRVHPDSDAYVSRIGSTSPLHPNFGSTPDNGIPINLITPDVPEVKVTFTYADQSDPGGYQIPPNPLIEGGSNAPADSDRHIIIVDHVRCLLFEVGAAHPQPDGSWTAGAGAKIDLLNDSRRPENWTSADASGLPILPGLVRYDEVALGEIRHAIRFTAPQTQEGYLWPATHEASSITDWSYPPMGARFRLKADFNISGYSRHNQVILRALKEYGMILADNGSPWFITGVPDHRWNDDDLHQLRNIPGSAFEAVDEGDWALVPASARVSPIVP